ncbi:hypothetical protein MMC28_009600 [Mycoblastus sanguinarius]|nr:hypothetical protein [Mycoblastus sanguinarius]
MIWSSFQSLSILLCLCTLAQSLQCISPPGALPTFPDCRDLTNAIAYASRLPGGNTPKSWGRYLPETPDTTKLPKVYWLAGRGPATCAVHVDVNADDTFAVDFFRLRSIGLAAETVVAQCLLGQSKIGLAYPSYSRHVYAKIVRTDAPFVLDLLGLSAVQTLQIPNTTNVLQIASVSSSVNITTLNLQDE